MASSSRTYRTLDGLRGLAAISVVLFHAHALLGYQVVHSGFLAVDLFFALSGFVIAHAYEARLSTNLSWLSFVRIRLARFYPLYLVGLALGCIKLFASLAAGIPAPLTWDTGLKAAFVSLFFLPANWQGPNSLFPLNVPSWSLFYELVVNVIYAGFVYRLRNLPIAILTAASGVAFLFFAVGHANASLGANADQLVVGFFRTAFSFFVGVMIYRVGRSPLPSRVTNKLVTMTLILLTAVLFLPINSQNDMLYDLVCIFVVIPAIVLIAVRIEPQRKMAESFQFLGLISYGIYAIHYPLIDLAQGAATILHVPGIALVTLLMVGLLVVTPILDRFYDLPARRWLNGNRRVRTPEASAP